MPRTHGCTRCQVTPIVGSVAGGGSELLMPEGEDELAMRFHEESVNEQARALAPPRAHAPPHPRARTCTRLCAHTAVHTAVHTHLER